MRLRQANTHDIDFILSQESRDDYATVYYSYGFREEGVLREAVKQGNGYLSLVIMSMLESEYFTECT